MSDNFFTDEDGSTRELDRKNKILYMPYNINSEDYSNIVKEFINQGFRVQLEIV